MSRHPNLTELDYLFDSGKDFELSSLAYEERTGAKLPKDKYYLTHNSALAKRASQKGYKTVSTDEKAVIQKTIIFKMK